jgi:cell wall-associated NlpC family hydrolase
VETPAGRAAPSVHREVVQRCPPSTSCSSRPLNTSPVQGQGKRTVVALAVLTLVLAIAPAASADTSSDPTSGAVSATPTPAPSDTTPDPAPSGSSQSPTSQPSQSAPSASPPTIGPTPSNSRPPSSSPTATAAVPPLVPVTGTDGQLPAYGTSDAYWNVFRTQQATQAAFTKAQQHLAAVQGAATKAQAASAAATAAAINAGASLGKLQQQVDSLAADLYRSGGVQLPLLSALLLAAPDQLVGQAAAEQQQLLVGNLVVTQAQSAVGVVALRRAQATAAAMAVNDAAGQLGPARAELTIATGELAASTDTLTALGVASPQTRIAADGCPAINVATTLRDGAESIGAQRICHAAVSGAATPQAALAIEWAFSRLGAAYACGGAGRMLAFRFDCSSLVSRAYHEGAGLGTAGAAWAPSTRDMVPWDGVALDPHYAPVPPQALRPGDLVLYDTGGATYRHVVMYLGPVTAGGPPWMLSTDACGDVAKVSAFWGFPTSGTPRFLVARRVLRLPSDPPPPRTPTAPVAPPTAAAQLG